MTTAASEALDRGAVPWLFAAALATTLPHAEYQPTWLGLAASALFAAGGWLWSKGRRLPGRWLLALLVAACTAGVVVEFRTLFGRDVGVAMLILFMAMKLLELRSRRDAYVIVILGYFLLLTHYFYSQSIPTGLWLLAAAVLVTATLIRLHGGPASTPMATLRYAGLITVQALPFLLVLYILFPRIAGPLWGLPQDAHSGKSGLSDQMSPGSIANLVLSADIAFRVRFDDPVPERSKLYWRGPVLEYFDGRTWTHRPAGTALPNVEPLAPPVRYETTLEPHDQRWLLALDAPTAVPADAVLTSALTVIVRQPVTLRQRYSFTSSLTYRYDVDETASTLHRNLQLPEKRNPRTKALAAEWVAADARPERLVERALDLFRQDDFAYTLQPPLLGESSVDDFLFSSRHGFCEHYASAFVVLMRAAGVPARVIGGYQGGDLNPVDNYLVVRQSDAHAWAEVWLAGRGWTRVDPTSVVAPARVESGIASAMSANEPLPALIQIDAEWLRGMRYRWEAINNAWNQYVLGYNPERQREFLSRLGLPAPDWRSLAALLAAACGSVLLAVTAWTLYRRPRLDPAQRQWVKAMARLRRRGIPCAPWESPLALAARVERERPAMAPAFGAVVKNYCVARYGGRPQMLEDLRRAVARLP